MMMLLHYTKFDDVSRGKEKKMEIILPRLAERLKPLRKRFGRTQKDMAELLGVTERHYQKIEYGHINVSATTLILLADYFHVTTDYLLGREDTDDHH
jgi:transcriptional regulator with XRE-family HTH domain